MTTRRAYRGGAQAGALTAPIISTDNTISCNVLTGWPDGSDGEFAAVIGRGLPNEEKILCASRTGAILTTSRRGYDGTTPQAHGATEVIEHVHTAIDDDEANDHSSNPYGHGIATDDRVVGLNKTQTLTHKTIDGTQNTLLNIPETAVPAVNTRLDAVEAVNATQTTNIASNATAISTEATTRASADTAEATARSTADSDHVAAADPHAQYLTQTEGDARYAPIKTDSGWVVLTGSAIASAGFTIATGWAFAASGVRYRRVVQGSLVQIELIMIISRTGAAIPQVASGNITNIPMVTSIPTNLRPSGDIGAPGPGTQNGRQCGVLIHTAGSIDLCTFGGTSDFGSGEALSFRGVYIQ